MKKLSFLLFVFYSLTLESKANWTRFYENWGDENKDEILSCSPLLRLEIRRHERGNQNYFDVELYKIENNNRIEIFNKKDQNLSRHRPIKEEIHFGSRYNNKIFTMNLDSQSNIIDIGDLSLNHNFDIVTNMRLRLLGSLSSNKQVRVFSEYEVNNPERIQGNPFIVMDDRSLLKKVLNDHIEKNPQLLNSSKDKDIVVFLGNTGSGKSTLMNYLSNKNLKVDDEDNIVLSNPSDSSAMRIGTGARSETLLPRFVEIDNLRMYDFPGFGDTRGTSVSLVNACFIKHILERAKTVRLMFIAGYDEVTASRGALFKDLSNTAKNLLPDDQIEECSALTITKSPANKEKGKLIQILQNRTERGILDIWIEQRKLAKMSSPFDQKINQNDRQDILKIIEETPYKKLTNVNIQATYNSSNLDHLRKVYFEEMQEIFVKLREENFKEGSLSSLDIEALTKMKKSFEAACFFSNLEEKLQQSALITLLRPISDNIYTEAWNSKKKELALDLRSLEDIIEEEITKRKRNLLVSPQDFAKTLNSIADISELLKKSQVPLNHKKSWATEALNEICNRNYSSIREWLKNILSKKIF
jgi:energy-coupling factor transporter ATP-binding protein EcfA2